MPVCYVQTYLNDFAYSNTESSDLWDHLQQVSAGLPIICIIHESRLLSDTMIHYGYFVNIYKCVYNALWILSEHINVFIMLYGY